MESGLAAKWLQLVCSDHTQPAADDRQHPFCLRRRRPFPAGRRISRPDGYTREGRSASPASMASNLSSSTHCRITPVHRRKIASWSSTGMVASTSWRRSGLPARTWPAIRCPVRRRWKSPAAEKGPRPLLCLLSPIAANDLAVLKPRARPPSRPFFLLQTVEASSQLHRNVRFAFAHGHFKVSA